MHFRYLKCRFLSLNMYQAWSVADITVHISSSSRLCGAHTIHLTGPKAPTILPSMISLRTGVSSPQSVKFLKDW